MTAHSRWLRVTAVFAVLGLALFRFGDRAVAIQDSEDKVWFGPVGITPGERALVNIYAVGNPNEIGNPNERPWDFLVRVFDRRGTLIQERRLRLAPGVIGSVETHDSGRGESDPHASQPAHVSRGDRRLQSAARPAWQMGGDAEIIDRLTARTRLVIGNPDVLPAESLAPPGAAQ